MAYNLFSSESTVHVLSPTEILDAVRATVVTPNRGVIAASIVPEAHWGTVRGTQQLDQYAWGIEWLLDHTSAIAAIGTQSIDDNGLLQHQVTFTLEYTPPGAPTGKITAQVDVPNVLLEQIIAPNGPHPGLDQAVQIIAQAEADLRAMAGG
jgi:hypothetical protein